MKAIGKRLWVFTAGHMPFKSTGVEPEFTSHDRLSILNTGEEFATVEAYCYFSDRPPVGAYRITVSARRLRQVRINDFIFPEAIPLDVPYALVLRSTTPVVIQVGRADTSLVTNALACVTAF